MSKTNRSKTVKESSLPLRLLLGTAVGVLVVTHSGCAILGWDSEPSLDLNDPVVQAGLSLRRGPASSADPVLLSQSRTNHEIVPGMRETDVRQVLGEPLTVENAGDDDSGNQRWIYSDPYRGQIGGPSRIVYFENGRVAGWRTY